MHQYMRWRWADSVKIFPVFLCILLVHGTASADVRINEVMALNVATITDDQGNTPDWIELHNTGATPVDLAGYGLSDDEMIPIRWVFPSVMIGSYGHLLVWASGLDLRNPAEQLHTNFKISSDGEPIILTAPDSMQIDISPAVPMQADVSYGRTPYGIWGYFTTPTPGSANPATNSTSMLPPPIFSHSAGFHTDSFSLVLTSTDPDAAIRYTLDGSEPDLTSTIYTDPIPITDRTGPATGDLLIRTTTTYHPFHAPSGDVFQGTVVRTRAFRAGALPSETAAATYLITPDGPSRFPFPVMSVSTDPYNLFDPDSGLYVPGPQAENSTTYGTFSANFHQRGDAWERRAHVEFFESGGSLAVSQQAGMAIHGNYAREFHQKSFRLVARSRYGDDWFRHAFFPEKDVDRFKSIIVRTGSSDIHTALIRDAVIQELSRGLGFEIQSCRPVAVLINGTYWGIHFLRDRYSEYHLQQHHGVDPESVDLLEIDVGMDVEVGDDTHFYAMIDLLNAYQPANPTLYHRITDMIDVDEFASYCAAEIIAGNSDWPQKNQRLWRARTTAYEPDAIPETLDGRWRWLMYDTERGFGLRTSSQPDWNTLNHAVSGSVVLRKLLDNPGFRVMFINRMADLMNTRFQSIHANTVIDSLATQIAGSMPEHIARWGEPTSMGSWNYHLDIMRNFADRRLACVRGHMIAQFGLAGTGVVKVDVMPPGTGFVRVNTVNPVMPWTGTYFGGVPVSLTAIPRDGYDFVGWDGLPDSCGMRTSATLGWGQVISAKARFAVSTGADSQAIKTSFDLSPNSPNPFNSQTRILYCLPTPTNARLDVFTVTGQRVQTLVQGPTSAGLHAVTWDGRDGRGHILGSGVYFLHLMADRHTRTRAVTLVR
jgi:hypothetical protein